ncbi:16S rRNA uridine-516 pseudouridylate synthase [Thiohalobacter thiocyanaticus]|uniref:Pseudouridine synthase n=1 Tax=Thiohalobacter thiocyanaticus TaxID=585455 RepID=A0A1Z4VSH2_9GAMM|nr:23S rRNA pseudouridine(2605) synthase RluB [Thiohalobacter thiocyanaticus]BAZ94580.1 16S rRNA uridine-516 pseudouridylate synthase [Thiohalobacter thiocyanaticus]
MPERLQKVLARQGLGSRRQIEEWIRAGRLSVNGRIATLGVTVSEADQVLLDGRPVMVSEQRPFPRVIAYHKPEGEITSRRDPEGRPSVFDRLPPLTQGRWVAVGRLDINTSGLLLLTDDGELANRLMHPSRQIEREYAVRVFGQVDGLVIDNLLGGVQLEEGMARFEAITEAGGRGANQWYHVVLKEGRNREVRRLWESQGLQVSRLIRVRYGPVAMPPGLREGRWENLPAAAVNQLLNLVGLHKQDYAPRVRTAPAAPKRKPAARSGPPRRSGPRRR